MYFTYWYAFAVQMLLLSSAYVIYFQCTLLRGLEPQKTLLTEPPANRLVIFIVDGLTVKAFFEQRCRHVPQLRQIFMRQGLVGISRGRVAKKGNAAQLTYFSGCYEDYLAAMHGMAIDTIFNRSRSTFAWSSAEMEGHFESANVMGLVMLDEWTLSAVRSFVIYESFQMQNLTGVVFYVQLQDLQVSKGYRTYLEQFNKTQHEILTTYNVFERTFRDQRTAYLLTSNNFRSSGKLF